MAEDKRPVVQASVILTKIQKGEDVEFDNVVIEGNLDISGLTLLEENGKPIIDSKISITNSRIDEFVKFTNVIFKKEISFSGDFNKAKFSGDASFSEAQFKSVAYFDGTQFCLACFDGARFNTAARFLGAKFGGANFERAQFGGGAAFEGVQFKGEASFRLSQFETGAYFSRARFESTTFFWGACFKGVADFSEAQFNSVSFRGAQFEGDELNFRDADFHNDIGSQEIAYRKAKIVSEKAGDREDAGYYFYREMEAKRKQKAWYTRYPEWLFIQLIFGYGVHPFRLMTWWLLIIMAFGIFYWFGKGISGVTQPFDYVKFSFATALAPGYIATTINPGYSGFQPISVYFHLVAIVEAIFGTFLWAAFIATFARKYMR